LKLVVSTALAGGSSSPGTSVGIMLVKPPNESGYVMPAGTTTSGISQVGAWPTSTTSATSTVAITIWSITISVLRRPVRSSQAPSSGPLNRLGSVIAATVAPASPGLSVRSSTSSTTPTPNISSETRASVAAERNFR